MEVTGEMREREGGREMGEERGRKWERGGK